jgi:hypothetical protein
MPAVCIFGQVSKTVKMEEAGTLKYIVDYGELVKISNLTLEGVMDARDFKTIRDLMTNVHKLNIKEAKILSYTGTDGTISQETEYKADEIPPFSFYDPEKRRNREFLKYVQMSDQVTSIGKAAFLNAWGLEGITLSKSLEVIDDYAFVSCKSLVSVSLPESLKKIGEKAFYESWMQELLIPVSVEHIGEEAFSGCKLTSVYVLKDSPVNLSAAPNAFAGSYFSHVQNSVLYVPKGSKNAYSNATGWKKFDMIAEYEPDAPFTVRKSVRLEKAGSLHSHLNETEQRAVTDMTVTGPVSDQDFRTIGEMFKITNLDLENAETDVILGANDRNYLTTLILPKNARRLGGYMSFSNCKKLVSVVLPPNLETIGGKAFYNCVKLSSVDFPATLKEIGEGAFEQCSSIESVDISATSIEQLSSLAFSKCTNLKSALLPPKLLVIHYQAFSTCKSLVSIEIPEYVSSIGDYAFAWCTSLESVKINRKSPPKIFDNTFEKVDKNTCTLIIPKGTKADYQANYQWAKFKNIVEQ